MSDTDSENAAELEPELRDMKIGEGAAADAAGEGTIQVKVENGSTLGRTSTPTGIPPRLKSRSRTQTPVKQLPTDASSPDTDAHEEVLGGEITLKMEPGKAPKLSRTASHKVVSRPPPLYLDLPDSTAEAKDTFEVLKECAYANKTIGMTEHALECDCSEEWDSVAGANNACGEDSDCINRATKMECVGDCSCGRKCQNQRFQRRQYANVTVIKTEKKGFGLRANVEMKPGDFIFEYIGEVIEERAFRRRMRQYDAEGIKHFYFMSLTKGEFVDATKKGNLGRFCNHSCNPNCFVDKWVVGDKLRMGIFAERKIKAGEELVFNYNVDRYGADPQPCYCGEPNCSGFIGGRTQTDNATKLSHATIEALGIDDGDGWDDAVTKKPRKKKAREDDEEYVNDLQPRSLEEHGVKKVMAALAQCTEKWIAVKLLDRLQKSRDEDVGKSVIRLHGYQILRKTITTWKDDSNVVLQVLEILHSLPRITRNKIQDSNIEEVVRKLVDECDDERVVESATELLEAWSKLVVAYRIPRKKRDPDAGTPVAENHFERRERGRVRSRSRSKSPEAKVPASAPLAPRGFGAPKGPAAFGAPKGPAALFNGPRPPPRPRQFQGPPPLPPGWFQTSQENGTPYYYTAAGLRQWQRPTLPANQAAPPAKAKQDTLQDIISSITAANLSASNQASASNTPQPTSDDSKEKTSRSEKWRDMPQEKLERAYEGTIAKHVLAVTSSYRKTFEKDDIKRLSKEVAKKLVRGDFKSGRVKDPTAPIGSKHEKTIRTYVKDFMEKAVRKKTEREKAKASRSGSNALNGATVESTATVSPATPLIGTETSMLSEAEQSKSHDISPAESFLKRKRDGGDSPNSPKKSKLEEAPTPPPPPPPPADDVLGPDGTALTPQEEESSSLLSLGDKDVNTVAPNGKSRLAQDDVMQLATPPTNGSTNGSSEHNDDTTDRSSTKHSLAIQGRP